MDISYLWNAYDRVIKLHEMKFLFPIFRPIPVTVIKQIPAPQPVDKKPCSSRPVWKDGLCEAPELSIDKTYVIRDTNYNEVIVEPGTKVPESYTLSFQCKDDFLLPEPNTVSRNFFARCQQAGLWDPPIQNCSSKYTSCISSKSKIKCYRLSLVEGNLFLGSLSSTE